MTPSTGSPILKDLIDVITAASAELRQVAPNRGDMNIYLQETRAPEAAMICAHGQGSRRPQDTI